MRVWVAVLVCACGGGAKQAPPPAKPQPAAPPQITAESICQRFKQLKAARCGGFATMDVTAEQCPIVFRDALQGPDRKDRRVLKDLGACMVQQPDCQTVLSCMSKIDYEDATDLRACTDPGDSRAVGVPPAEFASRNGADARRYHDVKSSKDKPAEACGISGGIAWLTQLTCDDGSHPLHDVGEAEASRAGNVGAGGRCGSIIDLYKVTCPEATYEIYVDGYICPLQ